MNPMTADLVAIEQDLNKQVVAQVCGRDVTRAEMSKAFDRVANTVNWKNPINATVTVESDAELLTIREAVIFFTGSVPTISVETFKNGRVVYRVKALGYYAVCGA